MPRFKVLVTDYAWNDLDVERSILADAELVVPDATDEATLAAAAADVDAIMTCWANVPAGVIDAAKNAKIIARLGIGLDNIDVVAATHRGMFVTNIPDYCHHEVAEHVLALMLTWNRRLHELDRAIQNGSYDISPAADARRLAGQTLGIVGFGQIGRTLAEKVAGLGVRVLATGRTPKPTPAHVQWTSFDDLLPASDMLSLHVPLTEDTRHLVDAAVLARMRPGALLINTARGGLVDETALAAALDSGPIAAAALDVQDPEPPDLASPLYRHPRVLVTPHAAFMSRESVAELRRRVATQVATRLAGGVPEHVVNRELLQTPDHDTD